MNVNELRIGNWVNYLENPCQVNLGLFTHDLKPIPLTEEWLFRFGFKKSDDPKDVNYIYYDFMVEEDTYSLCLFFDPKSNSFVNHLYNYFDEDDETDSTYVDLPIRLKYVHQLQNLYFSLSGEELKLNNKNVKQ